MVVIFSETKLFKRQDNSFFFQKSDHNFFTMNCWHGRNAQINLVATIIKLNITILRQSFLRNVKISHYFNPGDNMNLFLF